MATKGTRKSKSGAQIYMSEKKKDELKKLPREKRVKAIDKVTQRSNPKNPLNDMNYKTPKERGEKKAEVFMDVLSETHKKPSTRGTSYGRKVTRFGDKFRD